MKNDAAMRRINELTFSKNWRENKEIVEEVQKLGKPLFNGSKVGRKPRKINVWQNGELLVSGTASELEKILGMKENNIRNWVWKKYPDRKGRLFKYLEDSDE